MKSFTLFLLAFASLLFGEREEGGEIVYELKRNVSYLDENGIGDPYRAKRCELDLYYPRSKKSFPPSFGFMAAGCDLARDPFPSN